MGGILCYDGVAMFDIISLIKTAGYAGLFTIVFAESGLFFGFFLPGDSLLFTAGFLASQHFFNVWFLIPLLFLAAVLGDNVGYSFGRKVGPKIFNRQDSLFFHKDHLIRTKIFFEKYGTRAIILARFMPIVRTFTPILAGGGEMPYRTFFVFNVAGGALWTLGLTLAGYILGQSVPNPDRYILPIVLAIIVVSILPPVYELLKGRRG